MASSGALKMTCLAAALAALLFAAVNAQELAPAEVPAAEVTDMVPVGGDLVVSASPGAVATLIEAPATCLQCRCCSRSDPSKCEITRCCSTFNCDPSGRCSVAPKRCGCTSC